MEFFLAAYGIVWLSLLGYVLRIGSHQRRLSRTLDGLQQQLEQAEDRDDVSRRAA